MARAYSDPADSAVSSRRATHPVRQIAGGRQFTQAGIDERMAGIPRTPPDEGLGRRSYQMRGRIGAGRTIGSPSLHPQAA